jgi:AcrR family transcriptional regulator
MARQANEHCCSSQTTVFANGYDPLMDEPAPVQQLPRGRHGLAREEVLASQRARMLDAIAGAVADKGYARTSVADVLARARVSRETFYEHFRDKEDCFLAAYEASALMLLDAATAASAAGASPLERFERALGAYLDALSQGGPLARVYIIDVYAGGEPALRRRVEIFERFVDSITRALEVKGADDRFAARAVVAAASTLVTMRVAAGDLAALPGLRKPLVHLARRLLEPGGDES